MTEPAFEAAVARYTPQGKFVEGFARGKMTGDPAYRAALSYLSPGQTLLDVGCAEGYLLALAAETVGDLRLVGFDHDTRRLGIAERALDGLDLTLYPGDARDTEVPDADVIAVLDVLHYQTPDEQDAILARLAGALRPGGVLLVRDGRSDGGWRTAVTTLSEKVAMAFGRHKGDGVYFRPQAEMQGALEALGLAVTVDPCSENTPFANVLFVGRRA
ncbi:MAG: class I SAM-dependent methyltransferase [Myxococcota bacterium]